MFHQRLGCSSISFRHQDLATALHTISGLGFEEIDLGALPGVCDHVPYVLDAEAVEAVAAVVRESGLRVRSVNGDVGDLNATLDADARLEREREPPAVVAPTPRPRQVGLGPEGAVVAGQRGEQHVALNLPGQRVLGEQRIDALEVGPRGEEHGGAAPRRLRLTGR